MSYEDMARSHVKELVREAFGLQEVFADPDGDLPFPHGEAVFWASVIRNGRLLRVWSCAVWDVKATKGLLAELNEVNESLLVARTYLSGNQVVVEGCLPVESLRKEDLKALFFEVGSTSERLGALIAAVYGGRTPRPPRDSTCDECEG